MTQECHAQSGEVELNDDSGRSFVITRRNGDQYTVWVSVADYDRVMSSGKWSVHISPRSKTVYAVRGVRVNGKQKHLFLHQFITGFGPGETDHINNDGLDNRRSNLRRVPVGVNLHNTGKRSRRTPGRKGVSFVSRGKAKPWVANIGADGKRYRLGFFSTEEEAAIAYQGAALLLYGDFARFE